MITSKEIKERAQNSILEAGAKILRRYKLNDEQRAVVVNAISCEIEISSRMKTRAGVAYIKKNKIKLNYRMMAHNEHEIEPTAVHEFVHLVAENLYKNIRIGHGSKWKEMIMMVDQKPERTHSMKADFLNKKIFAIGLCNCSEKSHDFTSKAQVTKFIKGRASYSCRSCRAEIKITLNDNGKALQDQLNAKHYNTSEKFFSDLRKEK